MDKRVLTIFSVELVLVLILYKLLTYYLPFIFGVYITMLLSILLAEQLMTGIITKRFLMIALLNSLLLSVAIIIIFNFIGVGA